MTKYVRILTTCFLTRLLYLIFKTKFPYGIATGANIHIGQHLGQHLNKNNMLLIRKNFKIFHFKFKGAWQPKKAKNESRVTYIIACKIIELLNCFYQLI